MPVIATAAWAVPKAVLDRFPAGASALERYAAVFSGTEINSTFYRSHRQSTYERWAASVGEDFRFAVKIPKQITHEKRLVGFGDLFTDFLAEIAPLGEKRGPLLCQLPPSLAFDPGLIEPALATMRQSYAGPLVIEPRHRTWASAEALALLKQYSVDPVLADPAPVWPATLFETPVRYMRLHGAPKIYYSRYSPEELAAFRARLAPDGWCVLDNTASGAATENALEMLAMP